MTTQTSGETPPCFLCILDPEHAACATPRLEGRIVSARMAQVQHEWVPVITIDTGTALASVQFPRYSQQLVKELQARGRAVRGLTLRVYHLPLPPTLAENGERPRALYQANSYTLPVVEPDTLLNITDLNNGEYCTRQYLLNHLIASPGSPAAVRGNIVHACFKELLKEHDRGELMTGASRDEPPFETLRRHFQHELAHGRVNLALAGITPASLEEEVTPHLESLASWFQSQRSTLWDLAAASEQESDEAEEGRRENMVRAETFLLAPEIGLKGRLDLLWRQSSRQRLLELKTGGGDEHSLPRANHRWQVYGYHALLAARRDISMQKALATLVYSGTPGQAMAFGIPFTVRELQRVIEKRNILVLSHVTGTPSAPPGPSRCTKCSMLAQCQLASTLLDWQPPEPAQEQEEAEEGTRFAPTEADRAFFAKFYRLLHLEGRAGEQQQALLWKTSVEEHVQRGTAINGLRALERPQPNGQGEWLQTFACQNTAELRVGDEILLSSGNPITGEVVTGTILAISAERVTVWTPELISNPTTIERHETVVVHVRTVQNLARWFQANQHLRELVAGTRRPRFTALDVSPLPSFNEEQNLAVARALQLQDYLLISGPPGTGKTSVIAEIVKRLCAQGQRVLLAAFTNQAVDNMLKRLDAEGFHDYVRLGHERSVDEQVQQRLLQHLALPETGETETDGDGEGGANLFARDVAAVRGLLRSHPVVASTTATWSSEKYTPVSVEQGQHEPLLQFDVALIDEAGQLTIPAILGALRFTKRFILVGDEKQLPPLVLSQQAATEGLADSLFSFLKRLDADYMQDHPGEISAEVSLRTQYRMNERISRFASQYFYAGQLQPHPQVAQRVLELSMPARREEPASEPLAVTRAIRPGHPVVFLNVSSAQPLPAQSATKASNTEARAVRAIVAALLARGIAPEEIGIIAPYRAQVANLRRYLFSGDRSGSWQALPLDTPMSIDTVDRFQGGERPVIIMSFATTQAPEADSQLRNFLTNANRLNVALTRAQRKLILVGHAPALQELPVFKELLAYCRSLETLFPLAL